MTIAESIKDETENWLEAIKISDKKKILAKQDEERNRTTFLFNDGSALTFTDYDFFIGKDDDS